MYRPLSFLAFFSMIGAGMLGSGRHHIVAPGTAHGYIPPSRVRRRRRPYRGNLGRRR